MDVDSLSPRTMLPATLALIDDDVEYTEFLSQYLRERGVAVDVFDDSNRFLAHSSPYDYEFYVVDLMLPGIDGVDLIKVLRLRSQAGVLVVSGRLAPDVFAQVIDAGADMYLSKPVRFDQVALAIKAVLRRAGAVAGAATATAAPGHWQLRTAVRQLIAPDGVAIDLSDSDLAVLECFVEAAGKEVTRDTLRQRLGQPDGDDASDSLNATIYRLRRRIERATPLPVPLQSRPRVGYLFRAPLKAA
jgi:two-component system OmpR family response regulator